MWYKLVLLKLIMISTIACGESLICPANINRFSAESTVSRRFYECNNGEALLKQCPNGTVYWARKSKCVGDGRQTRLGYTSTADTYSSDSDLGFRQQPGLGNTFSLGTLYNAKKDYIMNGFSLWSYDAINKNKMVQDQTYSETDFFVEENVFDRMSHFDIKASLKLSFLGGLIEVGGSANYLRDGKETENSIRFNMNYDATTHSESIPVSLPLTNIFLCNLVNKKEGPTHVISSITYGMKAVFVFEKTVSENESKEQIGGSLQIAIKSIPGFQIEGSASVNVSGSLKETTKNMKVKLYGDLILDEQPTTYEEAVKIYKTLPKKVMEKPAMVRYQLTPITYYCDDTTAILNGISTNIIEETSKILGEMLELHQKLRTLRGTDVSSRFQRVRKNLVSFQNALSKYENNFKAKLVDILPKIKSGGGTEAELIKVINDYTASPYQLEKAKMFLEKRQREIKTIGLLIEKTLGKIHIDITDNPMANDNKCIFEKKYVMIYVVNVLPQEHISDDYIKGTLNENDSPWYDNHIKVGQAGKIYKEFDGFAKENFGSDHCFQIQLKLRSDVNPFAIEVFENGVQITNNFSIPLLVQTLTPKLRGFDRVVFELPSISNPFVTQAVVEFWDMINGTKESPRKQNFDLQNDITVTGLDPKTSYWFHLRYLTAVGQSVPSDETLCHTTPTSPPTNLVTSDVSATGSEVKWNQPLTIAKGLKINNYNIKVFLNQTVIKSITASTTEVGINDLKPAEHYVISCKVQLPPEVHTLYDGNTAKVIYESHTASVDLTTSPLPPTSPVVLSIGHHTADLKWDVPPIASSAAVTEYVVAYAKIDNKSDEIQGTSKVQSSLVNTIHLKDLAQGISYSVKVKVKSTMGNSDFSAATIVLTSYQKTELQKFKDTLGLDEIDKRIKDLDTVHNTELKIIKDKLGKMDDRISIGELPPGSECYFMHSRVIAQDRWTWSTLTSILEEGGVMKIGDKKCWKKCYTASDEDYSTSSFHSKCDNKGPTVTLVRAGLNVFGGYTEASWNNNPAGFISSSKAFLFSVNNNIRIALKTPNRAIYGKETFGPTFGGYKFMWWTNSHDMLITTGCKGSSNLGESGAYNTPSGYTNGTIAARSFLAGSPHFSCSEYEVYYQS